MENAHVLETVRYERFRLSYPLGCIFGIGVPRFNADEIVEALSAGYVFGPSCLGPIPGTEDEPVDRDD